MNSYKRIVGCLLLAIYSMVLLHNLVPHIHLDSEVVILANDHDHPHDHSLDYDQDHEESEDISFFHFVGHLWGDGFLSHESHSLLAHYAKDTKLTLTKLKTVYPVLLSFMIQPNDVTERVESPIFESTDYDQFLYAAVPLRAPPVLA